MREDHSTTPQGLSVLCQEAGKQAASWAPDAARGGVAAASPTQWRWKVGLVSSCCLLALVVVAAPHFGELAGTVSTPEPARPQAAVALALVPSAGTGPAEAARWQSNELVIDFDQVPLAQAIVHLSGATNTVVSGADLLKAPVLVTLHLRTGDVSAAWQHLLHRHATFSMSCSASSCQVWINSEIAASSATAAPNDENATHGTEREPRSGVTREEMESQPDGSC